MPTARFRDPAGSVRTGEWIDDGVTAGGDAYALEDVELLAPCEPTKLVCIGLNYAAHAAEGDSEVPDRPMLFLKPPNAVSHHGATVTLPAGKDRLDQEGELAVVIGEQCRHVDAADAMDVVAGYTAGVDLSNRDDQRAEQNWVRGKAFDNASPLGPALVPATEVPDDATLECRVNGETRQSAPLSTMIFSVPELIAEITTYLTLEPGDVILTGTPEGVGPLADGDTVEVDIEGIPTLRHDVRIPDA
jgi:2-keto-4-pentenoate hydratase/2-oxohepta-3-ene-1,7-dioic acid hydratase in catechol pathway